MGCAGLDAEMFLEFTLLGLRLMLLIGLPMLLLLAPLNYFSGDGLAIESHLDKITIKNANSGGMVDWAHAFMVWYVVSVVEVSVYWTRASFLTRRYRWLRDLPNTIAHTVMLTGIPAELRTDQKLAQFFDRIFASPDLVKKTYVTRKTDTLLGPWMQLKAAREALSSAEATWTKNQELGLGRPTVGLSCFGLRGKVDSIDHYTEKIAELKPQVAEARRKVLDEVASGSTSAHLSTGFVTFHHRVHRELSLNVQNTYRKEGQMVTWTPPHPADTLWQGLEMDPKARKMVNYVGYLLMLLLLVAYLPLVMGITSVAKRINAGPLQPIWAGVVPTLGMTIMNSFLPTLLVLIITNCFPLRSMARVQHELQHWYFWFLVFLVLLAAAVGQSVFVFLETIARKPVSIFQILAESMPDAMTFYLNLMVLEWSADALHLLRLPELAKFLLWSRIFDEEKAKEMSEPEDQDFCGMGARSAQETIVLAIGIVFCTLSPLIGMLGCVAMALKRLVYGYLMVFAETKKQDLGGVFWVTKLHGVYVALIIYSMLMTGVLYFRSPWSGPSLLVAPSIIYVFYSMHNFEKGFQWERLPLCDVADLENHSGREKPVDEEEAQGEYFQPELQPED